MSIADQTIQHGYTAKSIIYDAQVVLNDLVGTRYQASDLVRYLNDGQALVVINRPTVKSAEETIELLLGAEQILPSKFAVFVDLPRNALKTKKAIRKVDQTFLDAIEPDWYSMTPSNVIEHFCYDIKLPRQFLVYPPALAGTQVQLSAALYPVNVPQPTGDGRSYTTVSGNIDLPIEWREALICYVLHRAYAIDSSDEMNASLSVAYLNKFNALVGIQLPAAKAAAKDTP